MVTGQSVMESNDSCNGQSRCALPLADEHSSPHGHAGQGRTGQRRVSRPGTRGVVTRTRQPGLPGFDPGWAGSAWSAARRFSSAVGAG